jgi:sec-independent protein translocase protein TatA
MVPAAITSTDQRQKSLRERPVPLATEQSKWSDIMGSLSIWHWVIVLAVAVLLFGRGKIPELIGDVAKGINTFKQGVREGDTSPEQK